jgi:hypothetical protein
MLVSNYSFGILKSLVKSYTKFFLLSGPNFLFFLTKPENNEPPFLKLQLLSFRPMPYSNRKQNIT